MVPLGGVGATWGPLYGLDVRLAKLGAVASVHEEALVVLRRQSQSPRQPEPAPCVSISPPSVCLLGRPSTSRWSSTNNACSRAVSGTQAEKLDEDEAVDVSGERWWVLSLGSLALLRAKILRAGLRFFEERPSCYEVATSKVR